MKKSHQGKISDWTVNNLASRLCKSKTTKVSELIPGKISALAFFPHEDWRFKTTLFRRYFKKSTKRYSGLFFVSFSFNLYVSPLCYTSLKPLNLARDTPSYL